MQLSSLDLFEVAGIGKKPTEGSMFGMTAFVVDWSVVGVDWSLGTITPGSCVSHEIEVWWTDIEKLLSPNHPKSDARGTSSRQGAGGRPPKFDWVVFDAKIVCIAERPDGLPERHTLTHYMLDWCSTHWESSPSESVVRERVARLYPKKT